MMSKTTITENHQLLNQLFDYFLNVEFNEEDKQVIGALDDDVQDVVNNNVKLFKRLRTQSQAELTRSKYSRVKDFVDKMREGLTSGAESYQEKAAQLISQPKYANLQSMFKNLEEVTEKDEIAMLSDARLLDLLDQMKDDFEIEE